MNKTDSFVIVQYWQDGCSACAKLNKEWNNIVNDLRKHFKNRITIKKINAITGNNTKFKPTFAPTIALFKSLNDKNPISIYGLENLNDIEPTKNPIYESNLLISWIEENLSKKNLVNTNPFSNIKNKNDSNFEFCTMHVISGPSFS